VGKLDPKAVAGSMKDPTFMSALVGKLNPQVVANVINYNQQFLTELLRYLEVDGTARAINENSAWISTLLGLLNPQVIANVMNATGSKTTQLINKLSGSVVGYIVNHNGSFLTGVVGSLTPTVLTDALNTAGGQALIADMIGVGGLSPRVMAEITNSAPQFTIGLLQPYNPSGGGGLNPQVVVNVVQNNEAFIKRLIGYLHASVINDAIKGSTLRSYNPGGPKGALYDLIKPVAQGGLSPSVVAGLLNNNAHFLGELLGGMDPDATASILDSTNGRTFIGQMVSDLTANPANLQLITEALANSDAIDNTKQLMISLKDPGAVQFIADQLKLVGASNALQMVTFKVQNNLEKNTGMPGTYVWGAPYSYMYNTFIDYIVRDAPIPWNPSTWGR
jgi:hypothetical protein